MYRFVALIALCAIRPLAVAQPNPTDRWQAAMDAASLAENEPARTLHLRQALAASREFYESDVRQLETLLALAAPCGTCDPATRLQYLNQALRLRELAQPADARLADLLMNLGALALGERRGREALQCYRDALQIREKAGASDGSIAKAYAAIATAYNQLGDKTQARLTIDHGLDSRQHAGDPATGEFAELLEQSGHLYRDGGDAKKAVEEYERALAVRERLWGKQDGRTLDSMRSLAGLMTWQSPSYAEALRKRVIAAARAAEGQSSEEHYGALSALAAFYARHQRFEEAAAVYREAFAVRSSFGRAGDAEAARCLHAMAKILSLQGHYKEAIRLASQSLAVWNTLPADPRHETLTAQSLLAETLLETGKPLEAERLYRELAPGARSKNVPLLIETATRLSRIYERRGDLRRAVEKMETVAEALEISHGGADAELAATLTRLGGLYSLQARPVAAFHANARANRILWLNLLRSGTPPAVVYLVLFAMVGVAVLLAGGAVAGYAWLEHKIDRSIAAATPAGPHARIELHDAATPEWPLRSRSLLLSILTAGVYSFWARAAWKRRLFAQAEFEGDRFEYHGTGRESLIGWMKGLPVVALIMSLPYWLPAPAGLLLALAAIAVLWPVARAGAHRYRLNRTSWRGVRFAFDGATAEFESICLRGLLLTLATGGLYYPHWQVHIRRFLIDNTRFGDRSFRFTGQGRDLLPPLALAVPLSLLTFGLFWAWWSALRHRYFWAHTEFGAARFRSTVTGRGLLRLWTGNGLILIGTLGLSLSQVTTRSARFWSRHIELVGDPDLTTVRQDAEAALVAAGDYTDFLGFDLGFLH